MPSQSSRIFISDTINIYPHFSRGGVASYFRKVTDGVINHFGSNVIVCSPEARNYKEARHIPSFQFRGVHRLGLHDALASVAACWERAAVFYSPYYGNAHTKAPQIFTVYDMIHELSPRYFERHQEGYRNFIQEKKHCLERASKLIAISKNTADDILSCYPHLDTTKIVLIYLGVDDFFFERSSKDCSREKPFFLYVGNRGFYKNFLRLLSAFGQSGLAKDFDLRVISPIGKGFNQQEIECIRKYRLEDSVHLTVGASDSELRTNYGQAVALVYPSEYEGFGLPILEAMASGTLVAASNTSSMPEVGGDVAFYFDPCSVESMTDCLHSVAYLSSQLRIDRTVQGTARARLFTWARCQEQTVQTIKELI